MAWVNGEYNSRGEFEFKKPTTPRPAPSKGQGGCNVITIKVVKDRGGVNNV